MQYFQKFLLGIFLYTVGVASEVYAPFLLGLSVVWKIYTLPIMIISLTALLSGLWLIGSGIWLVKRAQTEEWEEDGRKLRGEL